MHPRRFFYFLPEGARKKFKKMKNSLKKVLQIQKRFVILHRKQKTTPTTMSKYITKAELKGYDFNEFEHAYLFDIVNRKDANGYNGRYFSAWYTDGHLTKEESNAVADMIWCLTLTFFRSRGYEMGKMAQTKLSEVAEFISEKMNIWSGEIIRWLKGMEFGNDYDLDVCDHCGLNTITIFINK